MTEAACWTLAETVKWIETRDLAAISDIPDPLVRLDPSPAVEKHLIELRRRCRTGAVRAFGRQWPSPTPGIDVFRFYAFHARPAPNASEIPAASWLSLAFRRIGPDRTISGDLNVEGFPAWEQVQFHKGDVVAEWPSPPAEVRKRGRPRGQERARVIEAMLKDMAGGVPVEGMSEKEMEHCYGASRHTCRNARQEILAQKSAKDLADSVDAQHIPRGKREAK
jgi:hypothetical protein